LVKNGVPFDVAFALDAHEALAYGVIFGGFESPGAEFDWESGGWREQA
jgi:hypothetical protein